jgi:hypothetical protein
VRLGFKLPRQFAWPTGSAARSGRTWWARSTPTASPSQPTPVSDVDFEIARAELGISEQKLEEIQLEAEQLVPQILWL